MKKSILSILILLLSNFASASLPELLDLKKDLQLGSSGMTVVAIVATWCPACKALEPELEELSKKEKDVLFQKIDVDKMPDDLKQNISAVPTTIIFKLDSKKSKIITQTIIGNDIDSIKKGIKELKK